MALGGKRPGAGRKPLSTELKSADLARTALKAKYGSLENALKALLESGEPALIKFVCEHAFGKSPDILKGDVSVTSLIIQRGNRTPIE